MKSLLTLLAVACVATIGFTGCASSQGSKKPCPMMSKKCVTDKGSCCPTSSAACPMKKKAKTSSQ